VFPSGLLQDVRNRAITGTVVAAPPAVREHDERSRVGRQAEIATQSEASKVEPDWSRNRGIGRDTMAAPIRSPVARIDV
jgi:hypothetical protein